MFRIVRFGEIPHFSWKVRKHKRAHQVQSDLVISLFACLPIKKDMLISEPFNSKMDFLPLRCFKVRPSRKLRATCIVQLHFKDTEAETQR